MPQYIKIDDNGNKTYFSDRKMTKCHRVNGPAFEHYDGTRVWYHKGVYHRADGPAIEYPDGGQIWYINGYLMTKQGHYDFYNSPWSINKYNVTKEEHAAFYTPPKAKTVSFNGKEFTHEQLNALIEASAASIRRSNRYC